MKDRLKDTLLIKVRKRRVCKKNKKKTCTVYEFVEILLYISVGGGGVTAQYCRLAGRRLMQS